MIFAGVQGKVGRAQENIGSLQSHDAKQFTKAHVIADGQTQMTNFFGVHCNDVLAGADPVGFPDCGTAVADGHIKGMELFVVGSQLSLGIDDHGAVVGAFLTALGVDTAAVQPHIQFFGQRGEALEGRSTGDRFCNVPDSGPT